MTYYERTRQLQTVRLAIENGYRDREWNHRNVRHFNFFHRSSQLPQVDVSWYTGCADASVTVGDTTTNDSHAVELLKKALGRNENKFD